MNALQELQLNRIARTQHLQKGENTFGFGVMQEEGIEKAHQVGEIKVGSDGIKRIWTQLANGKFDWRRVKRDKTAQQEPAKQEGKTDDRGGEKHEHEYKIEDAGKYIDNSNASYAEKKVAKYILLGYSEEKIKKMMSLAKIDSSVVDHVYKLGNKLASEAEGEAKRISKKENSKSEESAFSDEDVKKLNDKGYKKMSESDMAANEPYGDNWVDAYFKEEEFGDGGVKTTILADLGDGTYSAHTITMDEDGKITSEVKDNILSVDEHLDGEPKFEAKVPDFISTMTSHSGDKAFDTAYRIIGKELISRFGNNMPTPEMNKPNGMSDSDYEQWLGKYYSGLVVKKGKRPATKAEQLEKMKKLYEAIATDEKTKYHKARNEKYWSTFKGKNRKKEIEAREQEIIQEYHGLEDSVSRITWSNILGGDDTYDDLSDKVEIKPYVSTGSQNISFYAVGGNHVEVEIRNEPDWNDPNKRNTYLDISGFNSRHQPMEHVKNMLRLAERLSQPKVFGELERTLNAVTVKMKKLSEEKIALERELEKNY